MITQQGINANTPMGANLTADGATFRVWGPGARAVYLNGVFNGHEYWSKDQDPSLALQRDSAGYWSGFCPGAKEGDQYKYYVVGGNTVGYKRDPYARDLTANPSFPSCNCILRNPAAYPWHDAAFVTPDFSNMIVYQAHVGTYYQAANSDGTFLDVIEKIDYLAALGINVLQLLPIDEFETQSSMGYNGSDLFSPDTRYGVSDSDRLKGYKNTIDRLLAAAGQTEEVTLDQLKPVPNQLKALIDLCHLRGIAVVFDVVYNHGGGFDGDDDAIFFWDRGDPISNDNSLYFTSQSLAGGLGFALWKQEVRQFLIDNATFLVREYHVDGLRYDEISALVSLNQSNGWQFCQDLTGSVRFTKNRVLQNAEFWNVNADVVKPAGQGGAGFDTTQHDGLRTAVRQAIGQASAGAGSFVNMDAIAANIYPNSCPQAWQAVPCVENHDVVYTGRDNRIPRLADGSNSRSWYARSRSRVATGLLLTAPGIPQLFMGQEFLEDKQWNDDFEGPNRIYWGGLDTGDKSMVDFLRFTQDLIRVRWTHDALRSNSVRVFHVHNGNRVLAFHRWIEDAGKDVVVVVSLNDYAQYQYQLGFPYAGRWAEVFNSDVYDQWVNPNAVGNGGAVYADQGPMHGFGRSAAIAVPPNSIVVFGG